MKLSVSAWAAAHSNAQRKLVTRYNAGRTYGATSLYREPPPQPIPFKTEESETDKGMGSGKTEEEEKDGLTERRDHPSYRTKGNQRWMKLRTTVQISGAIQKSKPPLKREDSFLKRFSTRQIPEMEETIDAGEEEGSSEDSGGGCVSRLSWKHQRRKRKRRVTWTVVNPDGNFFFYWLLFVSLSVLYNLWTLIVREAFPELQEVASPFWLPADLFTDGIFLLDILVQLRTGYLQQGLMVYDTKKLAGHYFKSKNFVLDLLALFPLELAQYNLGTKPILRFPRFLKVYRVYSYYYIVESRTVYPNVWRVVNLIHILLILAHWFGCFYFMLSEAESFQGDWVYPYRPGEYATLSRKYLASLYWSTLTLTTIGDLPTPETNADKRNLGRIQLFRGHKSRLLHITTSFGYIFTIVSYLIGVFIFATIVGQVGNVITNRNANRLEFERLLDGAKTYMRHHKVPGGMKRRVLRWYDYSWSRGRIQGGGDINTALGLLPDKLKTELALHVNLSVLKKVTIFQECQPEFLHDLVLKMKAYIFTPGDMICRKGEVAREMFIIADGILEVISETGRVLTTMKAGDFFGEIGILNLDGLNKRTADVRSVGYSELFSLSREDVLTAMKDYPEAQEILQTLGRKRLMEARSLNRAWKMSAQQKKEEKAAAMNPQKREKPDVEGDLKNKSIVTKLKCDVKELRNVFKKSSKATRVQSESEERDSTKCSVRKDKEKDSLKRVSFSDKNRSSIEEEGERKPEGKEEAPQGPKPLGEGLPLLQRIKLLKEKEKEEDGKRRSRISFSSEQRDPPLLQRILDLKPGGESKSEAVLQNTANMAAQVLASTVRSQMNSSTSRTLKPTSSKETDRRSSREGLRLPLGNHCETTSVVECRKSVDPNKKYFSHKEIDKRSTIESDNESWTLIKKAVLIPHASLDVSERMSIDRKVSDKSADLGMKLKFPSVGASTPDTPRVGPPLSQGKGVIQGFIPKDLNNSKIEEEVFSSKGELSSKISPTPSGTDRPRVHKRQKIYCSIDDLSPEFSGLPFVKKLKILNERQKLAELEEKIPTRNDMATKKPSTIDANSSESARNSVSISVNTDRLEQAKNRLEDKFDDISSSDEDSVVSLHSPESNETQERRKLKSILKKFSSASTKNSLGESNQKRSSEGEGKGTNELRKLLRAQTVEGYVARHSKFARSNTTIHNTIEELSSPESLNENISPGTENGLYRLSSNGSLDTKPMKPSDNNKIREHSKSAEINYISNPSSDICQSNEPTKKSSQSYYTTDEPPENDLSECQYHHLHPTSQKKIFIDGSTSLKRVPKDLVTLLVSEIKKAIETHMEKMENDYVKKYNHLEYECRRREETIIELQKKIEDMERAGEKQLDWPEERSDESDSSDDLSCPEEFSKSRETILRMDTSTASSRSETPPLHWELHLLAQQLDRRQAGTKRALTIDLSQLHPSPGKPETLNGRSASAQDIQHQGPSASFPSSPSTSSLPPSSSPGQPNPQHPFSSGFT